MDHVPTLYYLSYDDYVLVDEAGNHEVSHDNGILLQQF
jgi:hypothetical protein